ncbi:MAG: tetratricopeptide repeat protein, partial [Sphingobacteriales bacterium]
GAKTDEEKVGGILAQAAFQKYQSGRYDEAVEDYKRAVKVAPNFSAIYRNWGVMESYEGHLQEADKLMQKAESLNNSDPQIYLLWGNILRKNGKFSDALRKYEKAIELDPKDHIVLNSIGSTLCKLGDYERADKYLREALSLPGFDSIKHNIIASTSIAENLINWSDHFIKDRNMEDAGKKLTEAIVILANLTNTDVSDPKIYSTLTKANLKKGLFHLKQNQKREAHYYLKNAFKSNPRTFNHRVYVISAGIELAEMNILSGYIDTAKWYIEQIVNEHEATEILKKPSFQVLYGKFNEIRSRLSDDKKIKGKIIKVNLDYNYVIIESSVEPYDTYIANNDDFIPRLTLLSNELQAKPVSFSPVIKTSSKGEKKYAKFIKLA